MLKVKIRPRNIAVLIVLFELLWTTTALAQTEAPDSVIQHWLRAGEEVGIQQPDSARYYFEKALTRSRKKQDALGEVRALLSLAQMHSNSSAFDSSITLFFDAARKSAAIGATKLRSTAYNGLGINYYYAGDYDKSEKYIRQSVELLRDGGHIDEYAIALSNLSGLYTMMGKTDEALKMLREAEKLLRQKGEERVLKNLYNILGSLHRLHTGRYDSAAYYFDLYVEKSEAQSDEAAIMVGQFNLGELNLLQGNTAKAEPYMLDALERSIRLQRDAYRLGIYNALSDLYQQSGRFEKAFEYKQQAFALNDSIFQRDTQRAMEELETKYETEKKERKIHAQEALIRQQQLENERSKRYQVLIAFGAIVLLLVAAFIGYWLYSRKTHREQMEREKAMWYQNIAHEIKTPLTLIKAPVADLMRDPKRSDPQILQLIDQQVNRLDGLVNDLMNADDNSVRAQAVKTEVGNPVEKIGQVVRDFRLSRGETARIEFEPDESAGATCQYPASLPGMVNNLVENALKYGGANVSVKVKAALANDLLSFEVTDDGPGIPSNQQQKIFERLYRQPAHRQKTQGKGIGLYYVKDLLDQLGGSISVESEVGSGARFSVSVPVQPLLTGTKNAFSSGERPVVLLVEDEPALSDYVAKALDSKYEVRAAYNGIDGIETAKTVVPDLVLTDVMMPGADGIELLEALKSDALTSHIPVVIFSARAALEDRLRGLESGADAYLAKPFDTGELLLVIRNLLQTVQNAQQQYREKLQSKAPFDERIKSDVPFLNRVTECVVGQMDNSEYSATQLAADLNLSRSQLHRKLQSLSGCSTTAFIRLVRLEYAKDLLADRDLTVAEIAYRCGFSSPAYFTSSFSKHTGQTPSSWRQGQR